MFLTGSEIQNEMSKGHIEIDPYREWLLNPNSYNVRLHPELLVYRVDKRNFFTDLIRKVLPQLADLLRLPPSILDIHKDNEVERLRIPPEGLVLRPGVLYLGRTVERTHSVKHVPLYEGRSSTARLGLESHVCGGWGDVGFDGTWTLEIRTVYPTRVYPYMEIGQVAFAECKGEIDLYGSDRFRSRYQGQEGVTPCKPFQRGEYGETR